MKKINTILLISTLAGMLAVSCDKTSGPGADPVVRFVRPVDPDMGDMLLTEVSMGSTVAIIGEGLAGVNRIAFNDQVAKLNPTLVTPTSIIVTVPSTMPEDITDKMYLGTSAGKTAEYDLAVIIPSPSVQSIECEYAPAGSEVSIYGNYFFTREDGSIDVLFPGNIPAEVKSVTETEIVCTVPEGADREGNISVTSQYGTTRSSFIWRNSEGLITDFEETASWNLWSLSEFASEQGCSGQYMKLSGATGNWLWPANQLQFFYINPDQSPLVSEGEVSDYSLVFEYCCQAWDDTQMIIWFNRDSGVHSVDGTEAQYHWKLYQDGFEPGVWKTLYIPLTEFNTDKEETTSDRSISSLGELVNMHMMFFGAAETAGGSIDIRIDNIRLVRNN